MAEYIRIGCCFGSIPRKSRRSLSTVTLDRSKPPALGQDVAFQVPEVKTAKLDNGMDVFVVERKDLPKVNVTIASRAGSVVDPAGPAGAGKSGGHEHVRGTKSRTALDIDNGLGDLGTGVAGAWRTANMRWWRSDVLKANLAPALDGPGRCRSESNFPGRMRWSGRRRRPPIAWRRPRTIQVRLRGVSLRCLRSAGTILMGIR